MLNLDTPYNISGIAKNNKKHLGRRCLGNYGENR